MSEPIAGGVHLLCPACAEEDAQTGFMAEFDCFDDGCRFECCGCGVCTAPERCECTGKGWTWHP
jgi:hypothetical protein